MLGGCGSLFPIRLSGKMNMIANISESFLELSLDKISMESLSFVRAKAFVSPMKAINFVRHVTIENNL